MCTTCSCKAPVPLWMQSADRAKWGLQLEFCVAAALFLLLRAVFKLLEIEVLWEGVSACSHQHGTGAELGCASGYLGIKVFMRSEKYFIIFLELLF